MSKAPPPITDLEIYAQLFDIVHPSFLEDLLEDIGVEETDVKPSFFSHIENIQTSAENLVNARWKPEESNIETAFLRLNTAVESLEKWAKSVTHTEVFDVAKMLLLEAYTLRIVATSENKISINNAQHQAKELFPHPKGRPPDNFMEPDRW